MHTQHQPALARYHHTMTTGNEPTVPDDTPSPGHEGDPDDDTLDATPDEDPNASQRRDHAPDGRFTRTLASVRRDAEAAELRNNGRTYTQIANELGYYDRKEAWRGVRRAIADVARPAVTRLIGTESAELDLLYTEALAILQRDHVTVSHGKVITWRNPETEVDEPLLDDGPKMQAIQLALRVRESYRKLHGLDQPAKQEISGGVKYEIVGVDPTVLT
jgi:hypothetical protein